MAVNMTPLFIFDLDGTLALIDHRRPILDDTSLPLDQRWRKFFAACVDDKPNKPVLTTLEYLISEQNSEIWIWSGRSSDVELETRRWLEEYLPYYCAPSLRMRPIGDFTPDTELKLRWLNEMNPDDRARLVAVFDDRASVVKVWRDAGIACFQVADGDF